MSKFAKYLTTNLKESSSKSTARMIKKIDRYSESVWLEELPKYDDNMKLSEVILDIYHSLFTDESGKDYSEDE